MSFTIESLSMERFNVKCIDAGRIIENIDLREISFFSIETFYRLFIPDLFLEYDKILYLDSDLVICDDVAELLDCDIDGYPIAGVEDVCSDYIESHNRIIGVQNGYRTINAGVLLMNLKEWRENDYKNECLAELYGDYMREERIFIFADQDVLNTVFENKTRKLDSRWNFQWQYLWRLEELHKSYRVEYQSLSEKCSIVHYAGDRKPWSAPNLPKADLFWRILYETPIFTDVLESEIKKYETELEEYRLGKRYSFPYDLVPYGSKIVVYGMGKVGKSVVNMLRYTEYARLVYWTDRCIKEGDEYNINVPIQTIITNNDKYDYILICVLKREIAEEIRRTLLEKGINEEQIIWHEYNRKQRER